MGSSKPSRWSLLFKPRRRRSPRYPLVAGIEVKCSIWASFHQLFSSNVASRGLFVPTDRPAKLGERAELQLRSPDGGVIRISAVVRHVISARGDRPAGLGLEVRKIARADRSAFDELVRRAATECAVRPVSGETQVSQDSPPPEEASTPASPQLVPVAAAEPAPSRGRTSTSNANAAPHVHTRAGPIVAIDFGTSRSSVAAVVNKQATVLPISDGKGRDVASMVGFLQNGAVVVGPRAREMLCIDPTRTIKSPKRLLGRRYDDREIEPSLASLAMSHCAGPHGEVILRVDTATYTVPQVCAPIIYRLKMAAEAALGTPVKGAVLTTPVSFEEERYRALHEAAGLAGINVIDFVDEPTAAALCHRFDESFEGMVAVYDFGGGTFDYSVIDAKPGDLQVVTTAGDTWLGGDDFDEALANAAADAFWREHDIEIRHNVVSWQQVLLAAEQAKRDLSAHTDAVLRVQGIALTAKGPADLEFRVTREQFSQFSVDIVQRSMDTCAQAMDFADLSFSDLNAVYLSGGTTYIPAIREAITKQFGMAPRVAVPPESAVVTGAAIYAASLRSGSAATPK